MKSSVSGETGRTFEFELTADELVRAGDSLHADPSVLARTSAPRLEAGRSLYGARAPRLCTAVALAACVALGALLVGIAKQRPSTPVQPHSPTTVLAQMTAAPEIPSTSASKPVPVRLANPFDATEIFEFPPGTSLKHARESMAEFLLGRARERHVRHAQRSRNRRELRNS